MTACIICRYTVELDDVAVSGPTGRGVCLLCYTRETGTEHRLARALWREVIAVATQADGAFDLSIRGTELDGSF